MCFEAQSLMASVLLPENVFLNEILDEKRRGKLYGRFLKMIDNLQTPKHKTNHKYRSRFPLFYL
ncbi:hypothetical protein LH29_09590 [Draconibacterium sediminis]|uniref:Uncharacterized protein n=1 Tax=Draconibacterium sediminis TaxID=1544798 RepID=A0A0D8JIA0_9BACT|nr:hypothetical protein LH29_09590 [Draconibacterium sediminis]